MVAGTAANPLRPEELELDACASFLVRHGLHLTALELAQEMQDLHGEDALCATLRTFLEDLPSHVLAGAAMVKTTGYGKDTDPLGTLPLGAAERSSRPWDERTLLLEYEMRLCKEDFAQAEERCEALQKELDKSKAVPLELQHMGDAAAADLELQSPGLPQTPWVLQGCSLSETLPLQDGEHADALLEIVLGVSEIVSFLPAGKRILMAPVLTRCALLQPKLLGNSVACLLPQLIPTDAIDGKASDVPEVGLRHDIVRCEVELALRLDNFPSEVLPVLLRDGRSRHELRRVLTAELCGVLGVTLTLRAEGRDDGETGIAPAIFTALRALLHDSVPAVRAMAATALARYLSMLGSCETSIFSGLDADIRGLCLDPSIEVLSTCRRRILTCIAELPQGSCRPRPGAAARSPRSQLLEAAAQSETAVESTGDCGRRHLLFLAIHSARMCAHTLARHVSTLSERGLWVLRLRLFLELLLACLPALVSSLATALAQLEGGHAKLKLSPVPRSAASFLGDLDHWEGEWGPLEGATAQQAAAEDDKLHSWLRARLEDLEQDANVGKKASDDGTSEGHRASCDGWLTDGAIEQVREFLIEHVTPEGFLPFEPAWHNGHPMVVMKVAKVKRTAVQQTRAEPVELREELPDSQMAELGEASEHVVKDDGVACRSSEASPETLCACNKLLTSDEVQRNPLNGFCKSQDVLSTSQEQADELPQGTSVSPDSKHVDDPPASSKCMAIAHGCVKKDELADFLDMQTEAASDRSGARESPQVAEVSAAQVESPVDAGVDRRLSTERGASNGQHIRVAGHAGRLEIDGLEGALVEFDEGDDCWKVRVADGCSKLSEPCGRETTRDAAEIGKPEQHGFAGTVAEWVESEACEKPEDEADDERSADSDGQELDFPRADTWQSCGSKGSKASQDECFAGHPGGDNISLSDARRRAHMLTRDSDSSDSDTCYRFEASDSERSDRSAGHQQSGQVPTLVIGPAGHVAPEPDPLSEWLRPSGVAALTQATRLWESGRNFLGNVMEDALLPPFPSDENEIEYAHLQRTPSPPSGMDSPRNRDLQFARACSSSSRKSRHSIGSAASSLGEDFSGRFTDLSAQDIHAFLENAMQSDGASSYVQDSASSVHATAREVLLSGLSAEDDIGSPSSVAEAVSRSVMASAAIPLPCPPPLSVPVSAALVEQVPEESDQSREERSSRSTSVVPDPSDVSGVDAADLVAVDLCPPLTFCTNSWVAAVVEIGSLVDLCDTGNTPVLDALCHTLASLSKLFGQDFKEVVIERQLLEALAPLLTRLERPCERSSHQESLDFMRAAKLLPVYCRVVVSTWPPEQAVDWLIRMTLQPGLVSHAPVQSTKSNSLQAVARSRGHIGADEFDAWVVQRWLWCELAGREEVHAVMLERAIWPAIGGELGHAARTSAAGALDALVQVMKPHALLRLVLPAIFALSDSSAEGGLATEAAVKALVPLASAWARVDQLGPEAEERITVHFNDVTEHGGSRLAHAGAEQLGRLAALCGISRNVIVGVLSSVMRLADLEVYAQSDRVQVAIAQTLVDLCKRPELTSQPVGVEALRATASVVCMRGPLLEPRHATLNAALCRSISILPSLRARESDA